MTSISALASSLSGLNAATTSLDVSASNIANQYSTQTSVNGQVTNTPYTPQVVDQVTLSSGGVQALTQAANPSQITVADPDNPQGTEQLPNVDPTQELINTTEAQAAFKLNLQSFNAQDQDQKTLLNILT